VSAIRSESEGGYTLIELLVVLLLLSFISLAIGSGLHFGTRVWEETETGVQAASRAGSTQSFLRELLASAIPAAKGEYVEFEGDPSHVAFVASAPRALKSTGIVRIEMSMDSRDSDTSLSIAFKPGDVSRRRDVTVDTGASTLRLAYLDASESVPAWLDRWHDRDRLPDAIRIEGGDNASRTSWPDFIARLAIAQRADCTFDPISLDCRRPAP
jgi:prepilin-type N-terminal cleavage/methylation domain-containing protein